MSHIQKNTISRYTLGKVVFTRIRNTRKFSAKTSKMHWILEEAQLLDFSATPLPEPEEEEQVKELERTKRMVLLKEGGGLGDEYMTFSEDHVGEKVNELVRGFNQHSKAIMELQNK